MDGWGAVDVFGSLVSGPAWRENQVKDALIHGWARSRDRWWRRAALVSTARRNVAARVLREVRNKLETGLKNPRGGATRLSR